MNRRPKRRHFVALLLFFFLSNSFKNFKDEYIKPALVKLTIHSYCGATLLYLFETVLQYRPKRLNRVTIVDRYNDNRLYPQKLGQQSFSLTQITKKFQPKTLIILKTIQHCNKSEVICKVKIHNHVLFYLINGFVHTYIYCFTILNINLTSQIIYRSIILFLFYGSDFFTLFVSSLICSFSC